MDVLKIPQYEDRRYKVQKGLSIHDERKKHNKNYLWKKIGVVDRISDIYLISEKYHLRGLVDEAVILSDGGMAPVDYKYAEYPEYMYRSHKTQILCYCMLVEETYKTTVNSGYIFYIAGGSRQVKVDYTIKQKNLILRDIETILKIIQDEKIPSPTSQRNRCMDCTYKNICIR